MSPKGILVSIQICASLNFIHASFASCGKTRSVLYFLWFRRVPDFLSANSRHLVAGRRDTIYGTSANMTAASQDWYFRMRCVCVCVNLILYIYMYICAYMFMNFKNSTLLS